MKKLLFLTLLILSIPVFAADVYYCVDDDRTGFDIKDNLKQTNFYPQKFTVKIDFRNQKISSDQIWYSSDIRQHCFSNSTVLYCLNEVGTAFSINESNLRYYFADLYNKTDTIQDPAIAHGICEKF